jgi:CheY-like chemotaxis protein
LRPLPQNLAQVVLLVTVSRQLIGVTFVDLWLHYIARERIKLTTHPLLLDHRMASVCDMAQESLFLNFGPSQVPTMEHATILLIEDNQLLRWCMTKNLTREGFLVVAPDTVEEALSTGTQFPFDVLLIDWRLPDGHTGCEVLAAVRQVFPHTPSILISAEADNELAARAIAAGFDRVLQKPAAISEIVSAIQACTL